MMIQHAQLIAQLNELIQEWREYQCTGYVPAEDGEAAFYSKEAVHNCADQLEDLSNRIGAQ